MRPALSRRLARAMDIGLATVEERRRLTEAAQPWRVATVDDLPDDMRRLVLRLEQGPPTP